MALTRIGGLCLGAVPKSDDRYGSIGRSESESIYIFPDFLFLIPRIPIIPPSLSPFQMTKLFFQMTKLLLWMAKALLWMTKAHSWDTQCSLSESEAPKHVRLLYRSGL